MNVLHRSHPNTVSGSRSRKDSQGLPLNPTALRAAGFGTFHGSAQNRRNPSEWTPSEAETMARRDGEGRIRSRSETTSAETYDREGNPLGTGTFLVRTVEAKVQDSTGAEDSAASLDSFRVKDTRGPASERFGCRHCPDRFASREALVQHTVNNHKGALR